MEHLNNLKKTIAPQQKRLADEIEKRLNPLFDALNCESLPRNVTDGLGKIVQAMNAHNRGAATELHKELFTTDHPPEDFGLWMSGLKELILRL